MPASTQRSRSLSRPPRTTSRGKKCFNYVLSDKVKQGLASWQYHSGGYTKLDECLDPFWAWCQKLVPLWMAPNLVTLSGLFCVGGGAILLRYYDPTFSTTAPSWVYAVALLGHFMYQTLDAVDGKHARATKSSSPLGQLFDHGCDAFTTNVVGNLNCHCMQYGSSPWTVFNTVLNFQVFFLAQWEEYHTGILKTNNGVFGLSEGQFAQFAMMGSVAILGPESWQVPLPIVNMQLRHLALIFMALITFMLAWGAFMRVRYAKPLKKKDRGDKDLTKFDAFGQLVPMYTLYALGMALTQAEMFESKPLELTMLWGVSCSFYTTQVIVAQMSKSRVRYKTALLRIVFPIAAATAYLNLRSDSSLDGSVVWSWAFVLLGQYFYYAIGVCHDLASALNIHILSIKK